MGAVARELPFWHLPHAAPGACKGLPVIANGAPTRYTQRSDARERVDTFRMTRGLPTCERAPFFYSVVRGCMVQVQLSDTDRIEWALKTFKKQVQKSGILRELRRRRHHVKPSEARQLKAKAARRRKVQKQTY